MTLPELDHDARMLYLSNSLREPIIQDVIQALRLPEGSRGLDVGCGIGLPALLLAEAVGPGGRVTGLDASASLLELAHRFVNQAGLAGRLTLREVDWNKLPFEDGTFDWTWSADAAGYAAREPVRVIRELARVVKPGGRVVVLFWSSQTLLPGHPALEARLNATRAGIAPFQPGATPETHYLRAPGWLREAGLVDVRAETFVRSVFAPLEEDLREALAALLEMRWGGPGADAAAPEDWAPEDWREYLRLCRTDSPDFILDRPDYFAFFTYSVFWGSVPDH